MLNKTEVLLVEDNEMAQMLLRLKLEQIGCLVTTANDGASALKLAKKNLYDLIFMDIGLPDINGIEVTKSIRELDNPFCDVPIIALTTHSEEDFKEQALAQGMNDFVMKPLNEVLAQRVIKKYVNKPKAA